MSEQTPSPHHDDANATPEQLLARAADDYATQQGVTREQQAQGGPGERQGVLPGRCI
ncbi:hypothetical protein G9272_32175 [Streptomyces asoensis]|uniref:Uncharacterized protein n=1 Tax=Streptomyces asoensis TaxID=249586 RepID=A0A6M4X279_9ACTN|nr:hypothetical protein [Streptomyces asoensis]QJT04376.1 hypothetical protein G9272_32175 [Streptomyces asoensis]